MNLSAITKFSPLKETVNLPRKAINNNGVIPMVTVRAIHFIQYVIAAVWKAKGPTADILSST